MKLSTQLHTGATQLAEITRVTNYHNKPKGGFWTSTYSTETGSGWIDFCESEMFSVPESGIWEGILLEVDPSARIYTVDSHEDLMSLIHGYPSFYMLPEEALKSLMKPMREMYRHLNFEAISQDYDAIHLTDEGQWATRMTHPYSLYGWDFESTLWFRNKFTSVKPIEIPVKVNAW